MKGKDRATGNHTDEGRRHYTEDKVVGTHTSIGRSKRNYIEEDKVRETHPATERVRASRAEKDGVTHPRVKQGATKKKLESMYDIQTRKETTGATGITIVRRLIEKA